MLPPDDLPPGAPGLGLGSLTAPPQNSPPPGVGPGGPPIDPRIMQAAMLLAQYIQSHQGQGGPPPPGGQFGGQSMPSQSEP